MKNIGRIFNIQKFCLHDGPGIRTTVFLKGCPLRCLWCHNPAGLSPHLQVQYQAHRCVGCGACTDACPNHCHQTTKGIHTFARKDCQNCMACLQACQSGALKACGFEMTADELYKAVMADSDFYEDDGGVTFSGGEPLRQYAFVSDVARRVKEAGYSVTVDTCGEVMWDAFEAVLPYTDLFLYDIKAITPHVHQHATGVDNTRILQNLCRLDQTGKDIWLRVPVIPTVNANLQEMTQIADLAASLANLKRVTLMPYHSLGSDGYATLGYTYGFDPTLAVTDREMADFVRLFASKQLPVA